MIFKLLKKSNHSLQHKIRNSTTHVTGSRCNESNWKIPKNHILQCQIYWPQATRIHHVWLYMVSCEYRWNSRDFLSHNYSCKTKAVSNLLFANWLTDEKYWMNYSNKISFLLMRQGQPGALWACACRQNYC